MEIRVTSGCSRMCMCACVRTYGKELLLFRSQNLPRTGSILPSNIDRKLITYNVSYSLVSYQTLCSNRAAASACYALLRGAGGLDRGRRNASIRRRTHDRSKRLPARRPLLRARVRANTTRQVVCQGGRAGGVVPARTNGKRLQKWHNLADGKRLLLLHSLEGGGMIDP